MTEAEGDEKSKFLTKLEKFDGRFILYNVDNLLALPKYCHLTGHLQERARCFIEGCVDRFPRSGDEMLSGVDFDDIKHYDLSTSFMTDPNHFLGRTVLGRFFVGSLEQAKKCVVIKTWDPVVHLEYANHTIEHPARLHNEVMLLTNEHLKSHPHLPKLSGYSIHKKLAVIYDFKAKGVLHDALQYGEFGWDARMKVAIQVSKLLYEFHHTLKIVIGSIDSSNLLIDEQDNIKLCEFGLTARMPKLPEGRRLLYYTCGIYSCRAPEFEGGNNTGVIWTPKIDIFAFGILLLELFTKRSYDPDYFPDWAAMQLARGEKSLVDISLLDDVENGAKLTQLAMDCLEMDPEKRPDAGTIVRRLEDLKLGIVSKKPKVDTILDVYCGLVA